MRFVDRTRGDEFCPECGEKVKWIGLISGMWIAVNEEPVLYASGGKMWLVEDRNRDAVILKDCMIYKPGRGIKRSGIKKGYEPHVFKCGARTDKYD